MARITTGPAVPGRIRRQTEQGGEIELRPPIARLAEWRITVDVADEEWRPGHRLILRREARRPDVDASLIEEGGKTRAVGLESFEDPKEAATWLADGLAVMTGIGAGTRPGRPAGSGTFAAREEFLARLNAAKATLRGRGAKVTQEAIARELGADERTLRRWLTDFGVREGR